MSKFYQQRDLRVVHPPEVHVLVERPHFQEEVPVGGEEPAGHGRGADGAGHVTQGLPPGLLHY